MLQYFEEVTQNTAFVIRYLTRSVVALQGWSMEMPPSSKRSYKFSS